MKWTGFKKYLVLIPLVVSFFALLFFSFAYKQIMKGKFLDKAYSINHHIDLMALQINKFIEIDDDWGLYNYEPIIKEQTEYVDQLPLVYAAAYNDDLELLTDRQVSDVKISFDPFIYPEFVDRMFQPSGELSVTYDDGIRKPYEMMVYWRWIPDGELEHKYVIITGVSRYAIMEEFESWIFWGCGVLVLMIIISQTWLVIQISADADTKRKMARMRG